MGPARLPALACALVLGWSGAVAHAQVNTESLRQQAPDSGLAGDLQSDVAFKAGNADFFRVGGTLRLAHAVGVHTPLLYSRAEYGTAADERFARRAFSHARWTAMWHPRVGSELFGQVQYDEVVRLKFRGLLGAGPRFVVVDSASMRLYLGTGYMLEREVLDIPGTDSHPQLTLYHRSTSYLSLEVHLSELLDVTSATYFQPRFVRPGDYRVLSQLELELKLVEHLALVQQLTVFFDSDPPDVVRARYDVALNAGLRLAL